MEFGIADYIVFFCAVGIPFAIGIFFAVWDRKRNTPVDYFLADRSLKTAPVALSFVATFQSSLLILGFPAEVYAYGTGIMYHVLGSYAAYTFTAIFIVPVFHPLKLTSVNEYFWFRYGSNTVRSMTLIVGVIYSLFYMATVMVGTSVALEVVLGIPFWGTVLIYTIITTIYTSVGGIKAVIWTDVFQLAIMLTGMLAILVKSCTDAGGAAKVSEYAKERISATDFRFDPTIRYQIWSTSFGTFGGYLYITLMQPAMQRVYSTPTVKTARNLYLISTPIYCLFMLLAAFEGATVFAYYAAKRCDIVEAGIIDNLNAILPFAVLDLFHQLPGLSGLFTACLSSAALSTMSSCLSSLSAVTYEDVIKIKFPNIQAYKATRLSKIFVLIYGFIAACLTIAVSQIPGSVVAVFDSFMGCFSGPVAATFLLSIMCRRATTKGVIIGALCGFAFTFWLSIGSHFSGLPPYPYMPPGATDNCNIYMDSSLSNTTEAVRFQPISNITLSSATKQPLTIAKTTTRMTGGHAHDLSTLETMYSISYIMYSLIGMVSSFIIGFIVSLCTHPPKNLDERCLFSFRKHVLEELCGHKPAIYTETDNGTDHEEETRFMATEKQF